MAVSPLTETDAPKPSAIVLSEAVSLTDSFAGNCAQTDTAAQIVGAAISPDALRARHVNSSISSRIQLLFPYEHKL